MDLTLLTLDAVTDAGIFNFERCDDNSEAIKVYHDHFEPEEPEDLVWHGLFCPFVSFQDWLIVAHVRNESGVSTQWFYQWKGKDPVMR